MQYIAYALEFCARLGIHSRRSSVMVQEDWEGYILIEDIALKEIVPDGVYLGYAQYEGNDELAAEPLPCAGIPLLVACSMMSQTMRK